MNCSNIPSISIRQKTNQNIQVYVRVRPLNAREKSIRSNEVVEVPSAKEVVVRHTPDLKMTKKFAFDRTFGTDSKQCEVYQTVVAPFIEEVLSGYNCTVFAYGQTGTGKTHTMVGTEYPELKSSWEDETMIGIIPRALSHLIDELRLMNVEYTMRISYLELYNEELCDLLSTDDSVKIRIFDDTTKKGSVIIQGLEEVIVNGKDDVYKLLEKGQNRRKTATTLMNAQSSRSHTVFSILVHIKENGIDGEEMLKIGKLNLVDLAGSENISKAGNEKGIRTRETVNINQSLLTLGRVITALVERTPHVPYRESKLTRLLQESLGGRTKTSIIATISPGHKDIEETLSTLDYAHRAKNIQNRPEVNQKLTKKTVIKEYTEEIDRLKRDLIACRDKNGIYLAEETYNDMNYKLDCQNKELNEKLQVIKALKDEMLNKEQLFREVSLNLVEKSEELKKTQNVLNEAQSTLHKTKKVLRTTKRRNKENQMLLRSEIITKEKLTTQATTLLEVVDEASTEHVKLQDTIDRRKNIENCNKNASEQFHAKLIASFDLLNTRVTTMSNEHSSLLYKIEGDLRSNRTDHRTFSTKIVSKIEKMLKNRENTNAEFNDCINKYSKEFQNLSADDKNVLNNMIEELKSKEIEKNEDMNIKLDSISKYIDELNDIHSCSSSSILELIAAQRVSFEAGLDIVQNNFKILGENLKNYYDDAILNLQKHVEKRNKIAIENRNQINEIEKILNNMKLSTDETASNEYISKISSEWNDHRNTTLNNITEYVKSNENFKNEFVKQSYEIDNVANEIDYNQKLILCKNEMSECNIATNEKSKEFLEMNSKLCTMLAEKENRAINSVNSFETEIKSKQTLAQQSDKQELVFLQELVTRERDRINQLSAEHFACVNSLRGNVEEYNDQFSKNISNCQENVRNFYEKDLQEYKPTGETPNRKKFNYPRVLAATSPHENLIKRFRCQNEWSDADNSTIIENGEVFEISDDFHGVNSTPIAATVFLRNNVETATPDISEPTLHLSALENNSIKLQEQNIIMDESMNSPKIFGKYSDEENKENLA